MRKAALILSLGQGLAPQAVRSSHLAEKRAKRRPGSLGRERSPGCIVGSEHSVILTLAALGRLAAFLPLEAVHG